MDWLHWIGKKYYTMNRFTKEAGIYGVTRRVSLQVAKQMSWGDEVYCAMLNGKTGVIFGYFRINSISGLSPETIAIIQKARSLTEYRSEEKVISRECGSYTSGPAFLTKKPLKEIVEAVEEKQSVYPNREESDALSSSLNDHLMVGGTFIELEKTRLLDIPFRQGFRKFDSIAFLEAVGLGGNAVKGQFYVSKEGEGESTSLFEMYGGVLIQVKKYNKA